MKTPRYLLAISLSWDGINCSDELFEYSDQKKIRVFIWDNKGFIISIVEPDYQNGVWVWKNWFEYSDRDDNWRVIDEFTFQNYTEYKNTREQLLKKYFK